MRIFQKLRKELKDPHTGVYAPYYYRYLGYDIDPVAPITMARANAVYSLFTNTKPKVYKNELIVGNEDVLYCDADKTMLCEAKDIDDKYGRRTFSTNADHFTPNYEHVVKVGITGLLDEIAKSKMVHQHEAEKIEFLDAMEHTLRGFIKMIQNYADCAASMKNVDGYDESRLQKIVENCESLVQKKPENFMQALQLVWFCHVAFRLEERAAMAFGRMDQYLYPFYKKDVENGILTREDAIELLENVFIKLESRGTYNICIGGKGVDEKHQVNELSYCILEAVKNCNVPGPNLSARVCQDTPDEFLDQCLISIGTGLGYPALMNDEINIPALLQCGYEKEDVYNYSMVGCIENFISGKQPPWSDGRFDTPKYLDYVFNDGVSITNKSVGLELDKLENIHSMEQFLNNYKLQLEHGVKKYIAKFYAKNNSINSQYFQSPFLSCFCHDCIGRGMDINDGGSIYPSVHGVALMGVGTTADSLAAVEKVVFVDKEATLSEIKEALNHNFEGYEELHKKLLAAPKYGNNDDFVDKYAVWFLDTLYEAFSQYKTKDGGAIYVAMAANISNIHAGAIINATPDGRKRGEPLSDAASPTYGRDVKGATTTINSVTKLHYSKVACGSVVNQKFSPSMFEDGKRQKLLALIKTYFKKGGQELQINATSKEVLIDAMEHPEEHQNLVVRVSGFSAYYITLDKEVQLDILRRTQQS